MAEIRDFQTKCKALHLAASEVGAWLDRYAKDVSGFSSERNKIEGDIESLKKQKNDLEKSIVELIHKKKQQDDDNKAYREGQGRVLAQERVDIEKMRRELKEDSLEVDRKKEVFAGVVAEFEKEREAFNAKAKKVAELVGAR